MKRNSLTLEDFKFTKTVIDFNEIEKYQNEDEYMALAVELFKEVSQITSIVSCALRLDLRNNPRKWSRNEAILGGLMIRLNKLQIGFLDQICQKRLEIANILFRCIGENIINLKYLLERENDGVFEEYIEYSLREEKRLLTRIERNIRERGSELPIETRMKDSIKRSFEESLFSVDQVNEENRDPWGETIYKRAKKASMEDIYFSVFSLPSHAVHGNWQDLITYHLDYENGEFLPKTVWGYPRPQPLFAISLLSAEINLLYLDEIMPDCEDKIQIKAMLEDIIQRNLRCDELHERFLSIEKKK
jgi:hypothetical protein